MTTGPDLATLPDELARVGVAGRLVESPRQLTEATSTWVYLLRVGSELMVLRVFRVGQTGQARREHALAGFLAQHDYPSARPIAVGDEHGPMGLPFLLQSRVPGIVAVRAITSHHARRTIVAMAAAQAQLHRIPIDGCPLPDDGPASAAYLRDDLDRRRSLIEVVDRADGLAWLHATAGRFADRDRVLCHGDFHPLNALVAHDGTISMVDWTDARLGDPHFDVARTLSLYWVAPALARNGAERLALRSVRGWLARTHRRAYESASGRRLDDELLTWWQAVHVYRGWLQLMEIAEGAVTGPESTTRDAIPADMPTLLLQRFAELRARLG